MNTKSQKQELLLMLKKREITKPEYDHALKLIDESNVTPFTISNSAKYKMFGLVALIVTIWFGPPNLVYNTIDAITPDLSSTNRSTDQLSSQFHANNPQSGMAYTNQMTLACLTASDIGKFSIIYSQQGEAAARAYGNCTLLPSNAQIYLVQGGFSAGLGGYQEFKYQTAAGTVTLFTSSGTGRFRAM